MGREAAAGRIERGGGAVQGDIARVVSRLYVVPGDRGGGGGMWQARVGELRGDRCGGGKRDGWAGYEVDPLGGVFVLFRLRVAAGDARGTRAEGRPEGSGEWQGGHVNTKEC